MERSFDVLVLGDANPDLVLRGGDLGPVADQREALVESATFTVGGSGAIFACAAARLGLRVAFAGVVGDDVFGRFMREELRGRGVDARGLVVREGRSTGVSVVLSRPGDRGTYTVPGTVADLNAEVVDRELLASVEHVHVASFYLQRALGPDLPRLLGEVRSAGATTSLDPNWDPAEAWNSGLLELLAHVDLFLPNAAEALRIAGRDDLEAAVGHLASRAGTVAVKLGDGGGLARRGEEIVRLPGIPVDVVDATGAGDAFDAGFVLGLLRGWPLERALSLANACGGLSCRSIGGVDGQPTLDEALAFTGP
ncbi:MAG: carbohydrate kinase family protein [Actinomycetota bacterium]